MFAVWGKPAYPLDPGEDEVDDGTGNTPRGPEGDTDTPPQPSWPENT